MTVQARLARPEQASQIELSRTGQRVDVDSDPDSGDRIRKAQLGPALVSENLVEQGLGLVLVGLLGQR